MPNTRRVLLSLAFLCFVKVESFSRLPPTSFGYKPQSPVRTQVMATPNKEAQGAKHYLDHITRFTVLHAKDLVMLLSPQIESSKTLLDIGCGPGTFALAYLDLYPKGIPGQTLILSDISPEMVQQAEETMKERIPSDFQTKLEYQVVDGLTLDGIVGNSFECETIDHLVF